MRPEELPELLQIPLSDEQLRAAAAPLEPGVIVAGAGSGKTTVMAARVVWLVGSGQVPAAGVLGLTFTNKATAELLHRVRGGLRRLGGAAAAAADDARVSTYHSFAGALLREFGVLIGVEPGAELMSAVRQRQLAYRVAANAPLGERPGTPRDLARQIVSLDGLLADHDVALEDLVEFDAELVAALAGAPAMQRIGQDMLSTSRLRLELADLVRQFRAAKREQELLDFNDYVRLGTALAREAPTVGELLRQRHQVVLLDEYQDTSVGQRTMLQHLFGAGHPVTAVGDPCQAIYGWRGASAANMDGFGEHFPTGRGEAAAVYPLATNRRSGAAILELANRVAQPLRTVHPAVVPLAADPANGLGAVRAALLPTVRDESDWWVGQVLAHGGPWRDVAVLVRSNDGAAQAVAALRAAGIPVQVHGKQALTALPEVRWVLWALRISVDPAANDALAGLLLGPPWRIGVRDMALLGRRAAELAAPSSRAAEGGPAAEIAASLVAEPQDGACLLDALLDPGPEQRYRYSAEARRRFAAAVELVRRWQRASGSVADLVHQVAVDSGLSVELALGPLGGAPGRPSDAGGLRSLVSLARQFDDLDGGRSLSDFLAWLDVAETLPDGPAAPLPDLGDAVTVMTVHAAKGLEFPVVVVPGLVAGIFPALKGRGAWPTASDAVPTPLLADPPPGTVDFPADPAAPRAKEHDAFKAALREAARLEETRLAYVAVTRARHMLVMSGHVWGATQVQPREPSPFLRAAAAGGAGIELDTWTLPPDEDAENPLLAEPAPPPEPPPVPGPPMADPAPVAEVVAGWDRDLARIRAANRPGDPAGADLPADLPVGGWIRAARDPAGYRLDLLRPVPQPAVLAAATGEEFHAWVASLPDQAALWDVDELLGADDALRQAYRGSPFGALTPVAVEEPVALRLGGRLVRGRVDAVYRIEGRYWIVDWKTGAAGRADPLQLALYRAAWTAARGVALDQAVGCFVYVAHRRYDVFEALPGPAELSAVARGQVPPAELPGLRPSASHRWD